MSASAWGGIAPSIESPRKQAPKARFNQAWRIEPVPEVNRAFSAGRSSLFHESWGVAPGSPRRTEMPVPRASIGFRPKEVVLLPLEVRQGAFCFAGERFLKAGDQSLIKDSL